MADIDWTPIRAAWPRLLARAGRLVDAMGVRGRVSEEDVVQAAVEALLDRTLPAGVEPIRVLQMNLLQAVSNVARQRRLLPLEAVPDSPVAPIVDAASIDAQRDGGLCMEVVNALGKTLGGDDEAILLLSAYVALSDDGVIADVKRARAQIMRESGLTEQQHMNAVRRLTTALGTLPAPLRGRVAERLGVRR